MLKRTSAECWAHKKHPQNVRCFWCCYCCEHYYSLRSLNQPGYFSHTTSFFFNFTNGNEAQRFRVTNAMQHWGQRARNSAHGNVFWLTRWKWQMRLKFRIPSEPLQHCSPENPQPERPPHLDFQRCELNAARREWRWQMRILFSTLLPWTVGITLTCLPACPCSWVVTGEKSNRLQLWPQNHRMPPGECTHVRTRARTHTHTHTKKKKKKNSSLPKTPLISLNESPGQKGDIKRSWTHSPPTHQIHSYMRDGSLRNSWHDHRCHHPLPVCSPAPSPAPSLWSSPHCCLCLCMTPAFNWPEITLFSIP